MCDQKITIKLCITIGDFSTCAGIMEKYFHLYTLNINMAPNADYCSPIFFAMQHHIEFIVTKYMSLTISENLNVNFK